MINLIIILFFCVFLLNKKYKVYSMFCDKVNFFFFFREWYDFIDFKYDEKKFFKYCDGYWSL